MYSSYHERPARLLIRYDIYIVIRHYNNITLDHKSSGNRWTAVCVCVRLCANNVWHVVFIYINIILCCLLVLLSLVITIYCRRYCRESRDRIYCNMYIYYEYVCTEVPTLFSSMNRLTTRVSRPPQLWAQKKKSYLKKNVSNDATIDW